MANDIQQLSLIEKSSHLNYLRDFRVEQCQLFLQHKCTQHRPFSCFYWHFQNQRRRRPFLRPEGTFSYDPDFYCNDYDEQTGICPNGDDCPYLHRNANDTEKRYHLRYYKTGICTHETDTRSHCNKNGIHCPSAHGANDLRQPILDFRAIQNSEVAIERLKKLSISLENERALNDDPKWNDSYYVLANYKTEPCKRPPRLCRQGYACPQYHNPRDRRRNPSIFKYKSTPCPQVKQNDEWVDPTVCESGDACKYCHTRTEQQFHPEIYKSTKCNDVSVTSYCPRGPFCAFAHIEQELKSYRDFDIHHTSDFPSSSFVPIPEDKEVGLNENVTLSRTIPKKLSPHDSTSILGVPMRKADSKSFDKYSSSTINNLGSGTFVVQDMLNSSPLFPIVQQNHGLSSNMLQTSPFLNDSFLSSIENLTSSHSYPPPSSYLSSVATSNFLSSINTQLYQMSAPAANDLEDKQDTNSMSADVKNLIGSSLTAIGFGHVDENDFDKPSSSGNNNDGLTIDESFERSTTPATDNTSPTPYLPGSTTLSRPMNIPHSFSGDHFSLSSSAKSPFDGPNVLFGDSLESPIDAPFPEPSTSSGNRSRPGELYRMAGFSQDLPIAPHSLQSSSPQSVFPRFNSTTNLPLSSSVSSSDIDSIRSRVLQIQAMAVNGKEVSEQWRRDAEEQHRLVLQLEKEKARALQQRDDALRQIDKMHQLLVHNIRLVPSEAEFMHLTLDEIHSLKTRIQEDLAKLSLIEQLKLSNLVPPGLNNHSPNQLASMASSHNSNFQNHQRHSKQNRNKHEIVSSNVKQ